MADFMVDPAELIKLADTDEVWGRALEAVASALDERVEAAAAAAGSPELSAAVRQFCRQWGDELRREAEGSLADGANLRTAAQQYQGTEDTVAANLRSS
jgi:hypothetical protein